MIPGKEAARKAAKERRKAFSLLREEREKAQRKIEEKVEVLLKKRAWKKLFLYDAFKDEVETERIFYMAKDLGLKVYFPKITGTREMKFYEVTDLTDMILHPFGMREPAPLDDKEGRADKDSLILMPGLAFDEEGNRIGYGGGYYDSFLKKSPQACSAMIAYEVQKTEKIDTEETDRRVCEVITERNVYERKDI